MRLDYETLVPAHAAALFPALSDPAVYQYIDGRPPQSVEELGSRLERMSGGPPPHRAGETWWNYVVRRADTGDAIGFLEATITEERAEIAYQFGSAHWGHGYATEAARWHQGQLAERTRVETLWATARPENVRSLRLLARLGYVQVSSWPALTSYDPGDVVYKRGSIHDSTARADVVE